MRWSRLVVPIWVAVLGVGLLRSHALAATRGATDLRGHWARNVIERAIKLGWAEGYPDGSFGPERPVTRAEFVKLLVVASGLTTVENSQSSWEDAASHWVSRKGFVEAAHRLGFLDPITVQSRWFEPDRPALRQEAMAWVGKAMTAESLSVQTPGALARIFRDGGKVPGVLEGDVARTVGAGLVSGYPDGTLRGDEPVSRAEAVVLLDRYRQVLAGTPPAEFKVNRVIPWPDRSGGVPYLQAPAALAVDADGTIYAGGLGRVRVFPPDSSEGRDLPLPDRPGETYVSRMSLWVARTTSISSGSTTGSMLINGRT